MAEQNSNEYLPNIFINEEIYPDVEGIFQWEVKSLSEIKDESYYVLDTNVLLVPYRVGKTSLTQIQNTYEKIIQEKQLIIPEQVVREFAKNRHIELRNLYNSLSQKRDDGKSNDLKTDNYPLLESVEAYIELIKIEEEIKEILGSYKEKLKLYKNTINEILAKIKNWSVSDPVTKIYAEKLFRSDVIYKLQTSKENIEKDLDRRQKHQIPPGYEDAKKTDRGVGDLLIWHSILELGKLHKKPVIFVSGEKKADWWHKHGDNLLYPRPELIEEFRLCSDGQTFHIIELSQLLELYKADKEAIKEVKQEENQLTLFTVLGTAISGNATVSGKGTVRIKTIDSHRNPNFLTIEVRDNRNLPVADAEVFVFARLNRTYLQETTKEDGVVVFPKRQVSTLFIAHPSYFGYIRSDIDLLNRDLIDAWLLPLPNGGSVIFPNGDGYLPDFQGRLYPIHDSQNRLYLYADNIGINGGATQPIEFNLGDPILLEDSTGKAVEIKIIGAIARTFLIEYRNLP